MAERDIQRGNDREGNRLKKVYICSPFRAKDGKELVRNINYARELTRAAVEAHMAPITPHLYLTQCLDEEIPEERAAGLKIGLELMKTCDFVLAGVKYGISEGMRGELDAAREMGTEVMETVDTDSLQELLAEEIKWKTVAWAKMNTCNFCKGINFHTCSGFNCKEPYKKAYEYARMHYKHCTGISGIEREGEGEFAVMENLSQGGKMNG